jgi:protein-tyrosine phosphatase
MKILMVCLGNICRSPLAEGILQHKADKAGLNWKIDSAGTGNYHIGECPHQLSQKVATANGINISSQQCRQFRKEDMLEFDLIYAMDKQIYRDVKRMSGALWNASKTDLILNEIYPDENREVPDPWFGGEEDFNKVYKMLDKACDAIIEKFKSQKLKVKKETV